MAFNPRKTKSMVVSRSRTIALCYGDLTLGCAELEDVKCLRILRITIFLKLCQKQAQLGSCAKQESYLIVHVCSRAVSMHMFCSAWSIVPSYGYRQLCFNWACWAVLFSVWKGCFMVVIFFWFGSQKECQCIVFAL